jgi:hypothetical protein
MRRPHALVLPLLAAAVLAGCGSGQSVALTEAGTSSHPTPSHHTPSSARTSSTARDVTGPLAGFPLDRGYADENGDVGTPVEITTRPATTKFGMCDRVVWDPWHGSTHRIGVEFRGEAEYFRGRTLVLYPDPGAATAAVTAARAAVAACPDEPDGNGQGTTHTVTDESLGDQAVVWTDTFYSVHDGEQQHDTGLVVYELVRVGRTVLLGYEYGEGNGSPASREQAITRTTREGRALAQRMRGIPANAASES